MFCRRQSVGSKQLHKTSSNAPKNVPRHVRYELKLLLLEVVVVVGVVVVAVGGEEVAGVVDHKDVVAMVLLLSISILLFLQLLLVTLQECFWHQVSLLVPSKSPLLQGLLAS